MRFPMTRLFLLASGVIAILIGTFILFAPHAFFATNHVALGTDPNLMSEIRAPSGLLLASGAALIWCAVSAGLVRVGLIISAVVFTMYGVSRLVSIALDGIPANSLIGALVVELLIGMIAVLLIARTGVPQSDR